MKKYSINFEIDEIGFEGELENIIDSKTFYIKETLYNRFLKFIENELLLK